MTSPVIVLVEDDPGLRTLTSRALQGDGFEVHPAGSAPELWRVFEATSIDLVILDVMLPGTNGIDLCRQIRQRSDVPIIFVSAKNSETDRIVGLELGADDYLPKPFGTRELVARVRAVLRRGGMNRRSGSNGEGKARFDDWLVDFPRREVRSPTDAVVDLTGAEFDLLSSFLHHPQRVISRDRLMELARTRLGDPSDRSIDVLVSRLRRKLSQRDRKPPIVTVRGAGYMLNSKVQHF